MQRGKLMQRGFYLSNEDAVASTFQQQEMFEVIE